MQHCTTELCVENKTVSLEMRERERGGEGEGEGVIYDVRLSLFNAEP